MPKKNKPWVQPTPRELLIAARRQVEENPSRWDQSFWFTNPFGNLSSVRPTIGEVRALANNPLPETPEDPDNPVCGTKGCVAGWIIIFGENPEVRIASKDDVFVEAEDIYRYAPTRARELTGLDGDQADYLFSGSRTKIEVVRYLTELIEDITARPPVPVDEPSERWHVLVQNPDGEVVRTISVEGEQDAARVLRAAYFHSN